MYMHGFYRGTYGYIGSKLLASPKITPKVVPCIIFYITPLLRRLCRGLYGVVYRAY